jgi:large subunit ribosomal protein L4
MVVDVFNMEGQKVSTVELPPSVFDAPIYVDLMHQAFVRQLANARLGTHQTKTRKYVSGGGKKPWAQKGTGRARQGSSRSPIWAKGAKVHTPHPRSYVQLMPKKMRRAALRSALSIKAAQSGVIVVDALALIEPKTRLMAKALDALVGDNSALVLIPEKGAYEGVIRSTRNLPDAKILLAGYLNIRDLLQFDKVVLPLSALDVIQTNLG